MNRTLTEREITELLQPQELGPYVNNGPIQTSKFVRWFDVEMRCARKGCSSPTYIKVCGIPKCLMHTIKQLTELCDDMFEQCEAEWGKNDQWIKALARGSTSDDPVSTDRGRINIHDSLVSSQEVGSL